MTSALFGPDGTQPPKAEPALPDALSWPPGPLLGPIAGAAAGSFADPVAPFGLGSLELPPLPDPEAIRRQHSAPLTPPAGIPVIPPPTGRRPRAAHQQAVEQQRRRQARSRQQQARPLQPSQQAQLVAPHRPLEPRQQPYQQPQPYHQLQPYQQPHQEARRLQASGQPQLVAPHRPTARATRHPQRHAAPPQTLQPPQRRKSNNTIGCVVALIFFGVLGFNVVTSLVGALIDALR